MALAVVVGLRFVIVHCESVFWVRLVVNHLVLPVGVNVGVPALDMTVSVRHLMPLLRILVVA